MAAGDPDGKAQEQRADQAERQLRLLIDSVRDYAIFMLDVEGRVATWNLGARLIKGYTSDEIIGQPITVFYTPEARAAGRPARLLGEARAHGRVEDEGWRVRKDGTRFWCDVIITALRDAAGELVGYAKVTRDLTERRRAEAERLHTEQRFRLIVESARDYAIFMLDTAGRIATWNEGAERIKGYSTEEILGQHFSRFYRPDEVAAGKCELELEEALRYGRYEDEGWRLRKDGSAFWANVVITPLRDAAGEHIGFSKITRDLTERLKAEHDRIELAQATESVRLRDEFMSIAAHELRTPLGALQLQVESLREQSEGRDPRFVARLDRAIRNVQRMSDLITTLLDVARIAKGYLTLTHAPVDLGALVSETIDRLEDAAHAARCEVVATLEPGITITVDALRISQIVANLLANAFAYAPGSRVDVALARHGDGAAITVDDRGPGIPPDRLPQVFERFERASSSNHGGMGLGLYIAREIALAHGGSIRASNREGGGAHFEVLLPIRGIISP